MSVNQGKFLDRSAYSNRTLNTYRIIGCHFVDIFYNHLYDEAAKLKNDGRVASITEGYRHAIFAFISALDRNSSTYRSHHYNSLLQGIQECFSKYTVQTTMSIRDVIDKIVMEFVPIDFNNSLTIEQKSRIMRELLLNTVRAFVRVIAQECITFIIDNHDDPANVELLKEKIVDILIIQRVDLYNKFVKSATAGPTSDAIQLVNEKANREIQQLLTSLAQANNEKKLMRRVIEVRAGQHKKLVDLVKKLNQDNNALKNKLELFQYEIASRKLTSAHEDVVAATSHVAAAPTHVAAAPTHVAATPVAAPTPAHVVAAASAASTLDPSTDSMITSFITRENAKHLADTSEKNKNPRVTNIQSTKPPPGLWFASNNDDTTDRQSETRASDRQPMPRKRAPKKSIEYDDEPDTNDNVADIIKGAYESASSATALSTVPDLEAFLTD